MEKNEQIELAYNFVQYTHANIFLTGKAGTGKTTFLRNLGTGVGKRFVVLAPTGVAALNAGGVTLHSFFQMSFAPYIPGQDPSVLSQHNSERFQRFSKSKINLIRSLDMIVVDEISMVRADILDQVSDTLKRIRRNHEPFGGVQLLMIGDLQQLSPVVQSQEWELVKSYYPTPFFFHSLALKEADYISIELKKIYRQTDDHFTTLLNTVREGRVTTADLKALNQQYRENFKPEDSEGYITLTTHNNTMRQINDAKLEALAKREWQYVAEVDGVFPELIYPADAVLTLKQGAQVMFVKNDSSFEKRYYNGKIGQIIDLDDEKVVVRCPGDKEDIIVSSETWSNIKFELDKDNNEVAEHIDGTFTQIPLRTAWAITIHKSQGLTFDKVIIDAAAAFAHGQVYVALSRCRTLEGVVLSSYLNIRSIISDSEVNSFNQTMLQSEPTMEMFTRLKGEYFKQLVIEQFDFDKFTTAFAMLTRTFENYAASLYPQFMQQWNEQKTVLTSDIYPVSKKFLVQLQRLLAEGCDDDTLNDRIVKGSQYFLDRLSPILKLFDVLKLVEIDNKEATKTLKRNTDALKEELLIKISTLTGSLNGFEINKYLNNKVEAILSDSKVKKKDKKERKGSKERFTSTDDYSYDDTPEEYTDSFNEIYDDIQKQTKKNPSVKKKPRGREALATDYINEQRKKIKESSAIGDIQHPELYETLREWRKETAAEDGVPIFMILTQKSLLGIISELPSTISELVEINGIGNTKARKYGDSIIEIVRDYVASIEQE